ncbi:hypothetical protein [Microvirga massiliensis]|uniref:hypothetical protein n=1 Tax=Microvirga massiliensis TaxID=1033741 RepID=UPI00062B9366|nr:hypothetical protein [Microvirga massiliensis]
MARFASGDFHPEGRYFGPQFRPATKSQRQPLIARDWGEGTTVCDPGGHGIGTIKRLVIEKISGRVACAVMAFGLLGYRKKRILEPALDTGIPSCAEPECCHKGCIGSGPVR